MSFILIFPHPNSQSVLQCLEELLAEARAGIPGEQMSPEIPGNEISDKCRLLSISQQPTIKQPDRKPGAAAAGRLPSQRGLGSELREGGHPSNSLLHLLLEDTDGSDHCDGNGSRDGRSGENENGGGKHGHKNENGSGRRSAQNFEKATRQKGSEETEETAEREKNGERNRRIARNKGSEETEKREKREKRKEKRKKIAREAVRKAQAQLEVLAKQKEQLAEERRQFFLLQFREECELY